MTTFFYNYTSHKITLNDGTSFDSMGVARVSNDFTKFDDNKICKVTYGNITGLPAPKKGVYYIVSACSCQGRRLKGLRCTRNRTS